MRVWLVKTGEPWPSDSAYPRLLRTGVMAQIYARGGDDVTWFNATFDHFKRAHRFSSDVILSVEPGLTLVGLHSRGYQKSVSIRRILDHQECAMAFRSQAEKLPRPDVIVSAMPTLELAEEALKYGRRHDVPVVIDVRDLWPDIWADLAPRLARPLARAVLSPYYRKLRRIVDSSSALCGISDLAVGWALKHGTRARNPFDQELPLAYEPPKLSREAERDADAFWDGLGLSANGDHFIACFFGSLSNRIDIGTIIDAARRIGGPWREKIRVVMCGSGHWRDRLIATAKSTPVLVFPGWINGAHISRLLARSQVGLLPYFNTQDFSINYPNKVFDYLCGGRPILTSLRGVTGRLVAERGCGWLYDQGDGAGLAGCLVGLAGDPGKVAEAALRTREVGQDFTAASVYGKFREQLLAIIEARQSNTAASPDSAIGAYTI